MVRFDEPKIRQALQGCGQDRATMTYDQWKCTPPEDRWPSAMHGCIQCGERAPYGCDRCDDCEDERLYNEAFEAFCDWEPVGLDEAEDGAVAAQRRVANTSSLGEKK
jgi:hypothetical protein